MNKKILYIRNYPTVVNPNMYNLQEVGLGKSLVKLGNSCDIIYYSTKYKFRKETVFEYQGNKLNIIWVKGFRLHYFGIYPKLLKKKFLSKYDFVITTEYSQIMTYLLSFICANKLILYHGPYEEGRREKYLIKLYDFFFLKRIINNLYRVFAKSKLAEEYLIKKGFKDVKTLGVGLDVTKFTPNQISNEAKDLKSKLDIIGDKKKLLYIGKLEDRRNIKFLIYLFKEIVDKDNDIRLIVVGNGEQNEVNNYFDYANKLGIREQIIYFKSVQQTNLSILYKAADLFILPTKYEIFGMVILESMYFGLPVVTSYNGGAVTVIKNGSNGIIVNNFDYKLWVEKILYYIKNRYLLNDMSYKAKELIHKEFIWDYIAENFSSSIL
ncbi:glycosyltransferase family 4 protein [Sporolactobacillus inulinus]|nr:glycosyltransferase family 4 protein [Sporolactobacillus inulinus]GEB77850.1 glycosyl transferase family 1 [Sporolactobacillus inulinus]